MGGRKGRGREGGGRGRKGGGEREREMMTTSYKGIFR